MFKSYLCDFTRMRFANVICINLSSPPLFHSTLLSCLNAGDRHNLERTHDQNTYRVALAECVTNSRPCVASIIDDFSPLSSSFSSMKLCPRSVDSFSSVLLPQAKIYRSTLLFIFGFRRRTADAFLSDLLYYKICCSPISLIIHGCSRND